MKLLLIIPCVLTLVASRSIYDTFLDHFNGKFDYTIDFIHNYRFEEHQIKHGKHLLVAISDITSDSSCHIIEISPEMEPYFTNRDVVQRVTEEVYGLIQTNSLTETSLSSLDVVKQYGDPEALSECYRHKIYTTSYTPSFTLPPSTGETTTAAPATTASE